MLHESEITIINKIRERLQVIERRLEDLNDDDDSYERGRLVEACKTADAALVSILVVAEVHLGLKVRAEA